MKKAALLICLFAMSLFSQEWYLSLSDSASNIEVRVDSSNGLYAIGTLDEGIPLTNNFDADADIGFEFGCAMSLCFMYGSEDTYKSHSSFPPYTSIDLDEYYRLSYHDPEENAIISVWEISLPFGLGYYRLNQKMSFVTEGNIRIEYELENETFAPTLYGLKVFLNNEFETGVVGPDYINTGVLLEGDDVPDIWDFYQEDITPETDQMVFRGILCEDYPDEFGLGEFAVGDYPIRINPWEITPESWIGRDYYDPGVFFRWDNVRIMPDDSKSYHFYLQAKSIEPDDHLSLGFTPRYASTGNCRVDSIVTIESQVTNLLPDDSVSNIIVCLHFDESSELTNWGKDCDTIGNLDGYHSNFINLQFRIPEDYSIVSDIEDSLYFEISYIYDDDSLSETFTRNFHTPYLNHLPPDVEFVDAVFDFETTTSLRFAVFDEDTTVNFSTLSITIAADETTYTLPDHYCRNRRDTIYCNILNRILIFDDGDDADTLTLERDFELCINYLEDMFGCAIESYCVDVNMSEEIVYDLDIGWNMISIPCSNSVEIEAYLLESIAPYYIFNSWSRLYEAVDEIALGFGFWYYSEYDTDITIEEHFPLSNSKYLYPGWNLIGTPNISVDLDTMDLPGVMLPAYLFNTETGLYIETSVLEPGIGYFIFSEVGLWLEIE